MRVEPRPVKTTVLRGLLSLGEGGPCIIHRYPEPLKDPKNGAR